MVRRVVLERRALAVAVLRDAEQLAPRRHDLERDDLAALRELDAAHTARRPRRRPQLAHREAGRLTVGRDHHDLVVLVHQLGRDELVALLQVHRDLAVAAHFLEVGERRLLDLAIGGGHDHVVLVVVADRHQRGHLLAGLAIDDVDQRDALRLALGVRQVVRARLEDTAALGEEQHIVVRVADDEAPYGVLFARHHASDALTAAPLQAIGLERQPLHVAAVRQRDHDLLVRNQILFSDGLRAGLDDLRLAFVAVLCLHFGHVVADQEVDLARVLQQVFQVRDALDQFFVLVLDLGALELGKTAELHVQHGLRLDRAHIPGLRHHLVFGVVRGRRAADQGDDLVDVLQRDQVAEQQMLALARLLQLVFGAAADDDAAVLDVRLEHLLQAHRLRLAAVERHHVHRERRLHRRVLVELVQHAGGLAFARELDDDAHAVAVRLVAQVADADDLAVLHHVGDLLDQRRLVHLVRQLGDDDHLAVAARHLFDARLGLHDDAAAPVGVRLLDGVAHELVAVAVVVQRAVPAHAEDDSGRRKVGASDDPGQLVGRRLGVLDELHDGVADLAKVVRGDVRRHGHGDAGSAVHQQVRRARRQHPRLLSRVVVCGDGIDGVAVDVGEQLFADRRHLRFGVAHGGRRIAVDAAEVALAIDEPVAHREVLGHAHHRLVDRTVAVRVVLAEHLTDDGRALAIGRIRPQTHLVHGVEDAALDRLQAVAHVRKGARDDHAHRVVEVRRAHLVFDAPVADIAGVGVGGHAMIIALAKRPA